MPVPCEIPHSTKKSATPTAKFRLFWWRGLIITIFLMSCQITRATKGPPTATHKRASDHRGTPGNPPDEMVWHSSYHLGRFWATSYQLRASNPIYWISFTITSLQRSLGPWQGLTVKSSPNSSTHAHTHTCTHSHAHAHAHTHTHKHTHAPTCIMHM